MAPDYIPVVMLHLRPQDFSSAPYKEIFTALCELSIDGKPINVDTLGVTLSQKSSPVGGSVLEQIGGARTIVSTLEGADGTHDEVDFWVPIIKKAAETKEIIELLERVKRNISSGQYDDPASIRNLIEEEVISLGGWDSSKSVSISVAAGELDGLLQRYIDNPDSITGLESGWGLFDKVTDGFQPGNVSIFYAPSSRFKSLFTANLCMKFAQAGHPGLWFTTEMPRRQVMERLLQIESGLNIKWLKEDREVFQNKAKLYRAKDALASYPIYFCDSSSLDAGEVRAEVSRHKRWHNIEYVLVDLVDHITSSRYKDEMVNNQRMVMQSMKQIAKDMDVHMVLVSHVNKAARGGENYDAAITPESMTGSASKFQDVDLACSIMPVKYDYLTGMPSALSRDELIELVRAREPIDVMIAISKNRHGEQMNYQMVLDFDKGGIFYPKNRAPTYVQAYLTDDEE